ncbi:transposase [Providencia rettgeri]|nr:transposase [Providencia rettgeri]
MPSFNVIGKPILPKRHAGPAWHNVKYLDLYLKRPPISASQLKHYRGGAVINNYYDHHCQQYRR